MQLSVIIVNYNTRNFIQLCLHSVLNALKHVDGEVVVVDNASTDDSCQVIRQKFPSVQLIANAKNLGFAGANNLGIKQSNGEYVLLLNPDTIVPEDAFEKCLLYFEKHPETGALGAKMLDGSGVFLPESKRGLPTPLVALYKMLGLHTFFPNSEKFAAYYQGNLNENSTGKTDVLTGAFFMISRELGNRINWLDEDYFMYGEDIDLSYCVTKLGFPLIYFPEVQIMHFKGESSKNVDQQYIKNFFGAMEMFYNKHFKESYSSFLQLIILLGIRLKSVFSTLGQYRKNQQSKSLKLSDFQLYALCTQEQTLETLKELCGIANIQTIDTKALPTLKNRKNVAVICTTDISYRSFFDYIQADIPYFFLAPDASFLLGSPSRKWNGLVLEKST